MAVAVFLSDLRSSTQRRALIHKEDDSFVSPAVENGNRLTSLPSPAASVAAAPRIIESGLFEQTPRHTDRQTHAERQAGVKKTKVGPFINNGDLKLANGSYSKTIKSF